MRIILDSNAFFVPIQFRIDVFEELGRLLNANFELILLSPVLKELEEIAHKKSPKTRKNAHYALELAQKCRVLELDEATSNDSTDQTIFETARKFKYPVFTNDGELRKKLRNINIPVIYLREKSHLEIDGRI